MPKISDEKSKASGVTVGGKKFSGWDAVVAKKEENDEAREGLGDIIYDFYLKDGESAIIQFLDDEPYCFDAHQVKNKKGKFETKVCQLVSQKYCGMCDAKVKITWKAAFKVLDFRGKWSKEKEGFLYDKPVEKRYLVSNTVAIQLRGLIERKKKKLSEMVLEVSRTGSSATDTSYSFEIALDKDDNKIKTVAWTSEYPAIEKLCVPPTDAELEKIGF